MSGADQLEAPSFARAVAVHSVGWLVAANLVGVWMGVCLLWPAVGNLLAPLTFGRWAPLHLDWQLYGWCALPAVGALLVWCFDSRRPTANRDARIALGGWSLALAAGGIAWLGGTVSGKLFLDWHGWARPLLPVAMLVLWGLLAWHTWLRWPRLGALERGARVAVLGLLVVVPAVLFWATGRGMYQRINPDSGGATGAAVLGSTLGIITIFMLVPHFIGVRAVRPTRRFGWLLAGSWLVFAVIDRGYVSHHSLTQIVALGTLLLWVPLLPLYWRRHAWPEGARPWLRAAAVWWTVLVVTGWVSFLPGISEAFKFSHALVGHAHLAMAGLITSVNAAVLTAINRRAAPRGAFWSWQIGCGVYVLSMFVLGWGETRHEAELFRSENWNQALMATRLAGGVAMAAGSIGWLWSYLRRGAP